MGIKHPVRTLIVAAAAVGLLVAYGIVIAAEVAATPKHPASRHTHEAFGYLTAVVVLVGFTGLVALLGRSPKGLIVGKDNRVSTSLLQVALWTYAIAFGLLSLIAMTWVGLDDGFKAITASGFDFGGYLVLLGGPFLAAVVARYLVGAKVANGDLAKPAAETPAVGQAVTDDAGNADLVDTQYLLFNLVALIYFLGAFFIDPTAGFPDIPTLLYALTGASAAGYVANKAAINEPPAVSGISPQIAKARDPIQVFGTNLLVPLGTDPESYHDIWVTVGGVKAPIVAGSEKHLPTGDDRFTITVPDGITLPSGQSSREVDVVVLNFRGVQTQPKTLLYTI